MANDLDVRLAKLERRHRQLQGCVVLGLVIWGGLSSIRSAGAEERMEPRLQDTIECKKLIVRGGKNSAAIAADENGNVGVYIFDSNDKPRILLHVDEKGSSIILTDEDKAKRITLAAYKSGQKEAAGLQIWGADKTLTRHLALVGITGGRPVLEVSDGVRPRAALGSISLTAPDSPDEKSADISSLTLFDGAGRLSYQIPSGNPSAERK